MRVLVTRDVDGAAPYIDRIQALGGEGFACPVYTVHPLAPAMPDLNIYRALIFTSAQGVKALAALTPRRDLPVYAVGPQTAEEAKVQGFTVRHAAAGTGADMITHLSAVDAPFLYGRARDIAYPVQQEGEKRGLSIDEVVLYETRAVADLVIPPDLDLALFFSARASQIFCDFVIKQWVSDNFRGTKALCLGAGMVEFLSALPWAGIRVADQPDRAGMLALIETEYRT